MEKTQFNYGLVPGVANAAASIMSGLMTRRRADQAQERFQTTFNEQKTRADEQAARQNTQLAINLSDRLTGPAPTLSGTGMSRGAGGTTGGTTGGAKAPGNIYSDYSYKSPTGENLAALTQIGRLGPGTGLAAARVAHEQLTSFINLYTTHAGPDGRTVDQLIQAHTEVEGADPQDAQGLIRWMEQQPEVQAAIEKAKASRSAKRDARDAQFEAHKTAQQQHRARWITNYNTAAAKFGGHALNNMGFLAEDVVSLAAVLTGEAGQTTTSEKQRQAAEIETVLGTPDVTEPPTKNKQAAALADALTQQEQAGQFASDISEELIPLIEAGKLPTSHAVLAALKDLVADRPFAQQLEIMERVTPLLQYHLDKTSEAQDVVQARRKKLEEAAHQKNIQRVGPKMANLLRLPPTGPNTPDWLMSDLSRQRLRQLDLEHQAEILRARRELREPHTRQ